MGVERKRTSNIERPTSNVEVPKNDMDYRPTIAITMGDPAGIGAEVIVKALADPVLRHKARYVIYGMNELLAYAADVAEFDVFWWRDQYHGRLRAYPHDVVVVDYDQYTMLGGTAVRRPSQMGGEASMRFCLDAIEAAKRNLVDAVVTAPIAKESWKLAVRGWLLRGGLIRLAVRSMFDVRCWTFDVRRYANR